MASFILHTEWSGALAYWPLIIDQDMNRLKKCLRLLGLVCLILLAAMGIGVPISFNSREKYMDYEVKTEQSAMKDEEGEAEQNEQKW